MQPILSDNRYRFINICKQNPERTKAVIEFWAKRCGLEQEFAETCKTSIASYALDIIKIINPHNFLPRLVDSLCPYPNFGFALDLEYFDRVILFCMSEIATTRVCDIPGYEEWLEKTKKA